MLRTQRYTDEEIREAQATFASLMACLEQNPDRYRDIARTLALRPEIADWRARIPFLVDCYQVAFHLLDKEAELAAMDSGIFSLPGGTRLHEAFAALTIFNKVPLRSILIIIHDFERAIDERRQTLEKLFPTETPSTDQALMSLAEGRSVLTEHFSADLIHSCSVHDEQPLMIDVPKGTSYAQVFDKLRDRAGEIISELQSDHQCNIDAIVKELNERARNATNDAEKLTLRIAKAYAKHMHLSEAFLSLMAVVNPYYDPTSKTMIENADSVFAPALQSTADDLRDFSHFVYHTVTNALEHGADELSGGNARVGDPASGVEILGANMPLIDSIFAQERQQQNER